MSTYEVNDDVYPFYTTVYIRNRWGSKWYSSSGVIVGNNDILTAAHSNYNEDRGGWSDETRVYVSWDPDTSSYASNYYNSYWRRAYTDWDENGDGLLTRGDGKSFSLYELEKDICVISLNEDIGSIYGWMGLKFDFNGGNASKLGHPGKYDGNLMYDEGYVYKHSIDNYLWYYTNDIEVNNGDSGGPIYVNSGGDLGYQVIGLHCSSNNIQGSAVALNAFANSWITEEIISNNYLYDKSFASITSEESVDEGNSISFTFKTHKTEEDKQYTYRLSGISSLDIASNELSGTTTINSDGEATFTIGITADKKTEGDETFTLSIGEKTTSILIKDTSLDNTDTTPPVITLPTSTNNALFIMLDDIGVPTLTIDENISSVYTYTANEEVTWSLSPSISSTTDYTKFSINSSTGALTFKTTPDYENPVDQNGNNIYCLNIDATDAAGNSSTQELWVSIWDVEEDTTPPVITLPTSTDYEGIPTLYLDENITSVHTYVANEEVTWSISADLSSATDYTNFTINSSTGALSFNIAPDYENPVDSGGYNIYALTVNATDTAENISSQRLWVVINDVVNESDTEKPIIYGVNGVTTPSSAFYMNENESYINTYVASEKVTWSLPTYWDDNSLFTIDPVSGVLRFKQAPDYENPSPLSGTHSNIDKDYITFFPVIRATDSAGNYTQQSMYLLVEDIDNEEAKTSTTTAATSTDLQQLYIGYFGRPCDPEGLDYWLGTEITTKAFAANMYLQPEFNSVNGSLSTRAQVNQIYLNLFNRDGDSGGLDYWTENINAGTLELASIANDLVWAALNNAGSEIDGTTLNHKTNAAILYTYEIKSSSSSKLAYQPVSTSPWVTGNNLDEAKTFINSIGYSTVATLSDIENSIARFSSTPAAASFELAPLSQPDFLNHMYEVPPCSASDLLNDSLGLLENDLESNDKYLLGFSKSTDNSFILCETNVLA